MDLSACIQIISDQFSLLYRYSDGKDITLV